MYRRFATIPPMESLRVQAHSCREEAERADTRAAELEKESASHRVAAERLRMAASEYDTAADRLAEATAI